MFGTRWVCDLMLRMSIQSAADLHVLAALYVVTLSFCGKFGTYWYNDMSAVKVPILLSRVTAHARL